MIYIILSIVVVVFDQMCKEKGKNVDFFFHPSLLLLMV